LNIQLFFSYDPGVSDTRWLTQDEQRTWRAYLAATQQLQEQLDRELQRDSGVPLAYYQILAMLSEAPGRSLRMSELAALTWYSRSRLSHAVDRLEEQGWVERKRCPGDRRGAFAVLTDAGFEFLVGAAPNHVAGVRRHLFDRLTPAQLAQLEAICATISEDLPGRETPAADC
jgi:DNA-binding MarR family transcriptional regulator